MLAYDMYPAREMLLTLALFIAALWACLRFRRIPAAVFRIIGIAAGVYFVFGVLIEAPELATFEHPCRDDYERALPRACADPRFVRAMDNELRAAIVLTVACFGLAVAGLCVGLAKVLKLRP